MQVLLVVEIEVKDVVRWRVLGSWVKSQYHFQSSIKTRARLIWEKQYEEYEWSKWDYLCVLGASHLCSPTSVKRLKDRLLMTNLCLLSVQTYYQVFLCYKRIGQLRLEELFCLITASFILPLLSAVWNGCVMHVFSLHSCNWPWWGILIGFCDVNHGATNKRLHLSKTGNGACLVISIKQP